MAVSLLYPATGCSLFAPRTETVLIDSEPQGAQVMIPGRRLTTPATITVPCDRALTIIVKMDGFHTQAQHVRRTLGKCGILDVVGAALFIVPAVGLISPGAYTLEQHTVFCPLKKKGADD